MNYNYCPTINTMNKLKAKQHAQKEDKYHKTKSANPRLQKEIKYRQKRQHVEDIQDIEVIKNKQEENEPVDEI